MPRPASVLVVDPPWPSSPRGDRPHPYGLMSLAELRSLKLPPTNQSTVLFLWRLTSMQQEALLICQAWGFRPYGELVWAKTTTTGKPWFGMGSFLRASHETCLIAVRKRPPVLSRSVRSIFSAPYAGHSVKPDAFYEIVESLLPGPYVELFARKQRRGWRCSGLELDSKKY